MTKIAINGFGRIGRLTFKNILSQDKLEVVAINDLAKPEILAHLLKYDSNYGIYQKGVEIKNGSLAVNGKKVKMISEKDPQKLPWKELGVDIVLECTGVFRHKEDAQKHLQAGAQQVIISAPAKSKGVRSFVLGVNEGKFDPQKDEICDMGSCTTNCLAPVAKVLNDKFKIVQGLMTTIHSYTTSQKILDLPKEDLRRARAAAVNIVPTTTGAAKAIGKVMPELKGKLDGLAVRVPTPTVSIIDLVCQVEKDTTAQEVNFLFKKISDKGDLKGILGVEDAPLVSSDYVGNSYSAVVDAPQTRVINNLVKILAWYDNEWGYATRLAEFAEYVAQKIK